MNSQTMYIANKAIETYKEVKTELRFDGEYINHFASLVFADQNENIDIEKIKEIRKYIKKNTKSLQSFRGDMLYMISILISREENYEEFSDTLIEVNETLKDNGFKSSPYLVLASYSIVKRSNKSERKRVLTNMKLIYSLLYKEFNNITDDEDYLICALLAIKFVRDNEEPKEVLKYIESMFNSLLDLENYSRNDLQNIATSMLLNSSATAQYEIKDLINEFKESDMKIGDQVLNIISVVARDEDIRTYVQNVKDVVEYLCDEEGEYAFYMDKTFRTMIGIVIVELYERKESGFTNRYLKELLCFSIYSFIARKKQNVFEEVLA
ncbi:DUF4003 family protein [Clostridium chrysemydis]|uniref:DUF4003 family protein n=1 Tax=Clostridium chrysemydis TaxID=2665504 RepID=UPI003F368008